MYKNALLHFANTNKTVQESVTYEKENIHKTNEMLISGKYEIKVAVSQMQVDLFCSMHIQCKRNNEYINTQTITQIGK